MYKKEECVNNLCDESTKTCTATKEGEECTKVEECAYGQTCRANDAGKKVCIAPAKDQEKCIVETDCEIDHGCYNNKCTSYYTLADGEFVGVSTSIEHSHSLCKSGFSNENGICQTLTKEEEKTICDEEKPCKYKNGEETLTLPENCLCGYNRNEYSYCKLGSGEKPFVQYVEMYKRYYFSLGKCHLAERGGDGCLEDILNGEQTIKQNLHLLYNAKLKLYTITEFMTLINAHYKSNFLTIRYRSQFLNAQSINVTLLEQNVLKAPTLQKVTR